jgi:ankyrin repeat protein
LLDRGAEIDAQDSGGFTALAIAAGEDEDGRLGKTALLLERGASPNLRIHSNGAGSVLHTAAAWGWFGIIKLLVQAKGIDLNLRDDEGRTPLSFIREEGSAEIMEFLIKSGATD